MQQGTHTRTDGRRAAQVRRAHRLGCGVPQPGLAGVVAPRHSTRPVVAASPLVLAGAHGRSLALTRRRFRSALTRARFRTTCRVRAAATRSVGPVLAGGIPWPVLAGGIPWRVVLHPTTEVRPTGAGFGGFVLCRCFSRPSRRTAVPCGLAVLRYAADTQRATRRRPRGDRAAVSAPMRQGGR